MLENGEAGQTLGASGAKGYSGVKTAEKCKPDYEGMIKRLGARLAKTTKLRDATLEYFEGTSVRGDMATLIGELVTKANAEQLEIDSLIRAQEEDK